MNGKTIQAKQLNKYLNKKEVWIMDEKYEKVKEILKKYNQEQLLIWYDKLIEQKKEELLDQILKIDFDRIEELYQETKGKKDVKDCKVEPLSYIDKQKIPAEEREKYKKE